MEMNVIFEFVGGLSFTIAVHIMDTIRDVKEKIQNLLEIPISHQIFILDGQFLQDHLHVLNTTIHPGSRILLCLQPNAANLALPPPPPLPPFQPQPMLSSWPQLTLYHPLDDIMQPMPRTTPLVPMLPSHQEVLMPANTPLIQVPAISRLFHAPEITPVVTPMRTQAVEVPASATVARATERNPVVLMPQWKPVVPMAAGSQVLAMQHMRSNIDKLEELAANTEKESPAASFPVLAMQHWLSNIELEEAAAIKEKEESLAAAITEKEESLAAAKRRKVTVKVKIVDCKGARIPIETELDDTVLMLKERMIEDLKICCSFFESEDVTTERMVLQLPSTHVELLDHELLRDCLPSENPEIDLFLETVSSSACR